MAIKNILTKGFTEHLSWQYMLYLLYLYRKRTSDKNDDLKYISYRTHKLVPYLWVKRHIFIWQYLFCSSCFSPKSYIDIWQGWHAGQVKGRALSGHKEFIGGLLQKVNPIINIEVYTAGVVNGG
jgi:hypothetical protein